LLANYWDNAVWDASLWDGEDPPPSPEAPLGGHFGFDENIRNKQWDSELNAQKQRRLKLQEELFGLPPEQIEQITSSPEETIALAAVNYVDYDLLLQQISVIKQQIDDNLDELDIELLMEHL
jgi:uncharacterized protein YlzI (FlbEa/FlbD family)